MRRYILIFVLFFCFIFNIPHLTHAQSPAYPTPGVAIPGATCGDPFSTISDVRKCCKMPVFTPDLYAEAISKEIPIIGSAVSKFIGDKLRDKLAPILFTQTQVTAQPCLVGTPSTPGDTNNDKCICIVEPTKAPLGALVPMCNNIDSKTGEKGKCLSCAQGGGVWTSLGCFEGNINTFITQGLLGSGIGFAGGITMLCIIFSAFQMQTSRGNAEKVKKAQEMMTNCITGLMVIIFSILILKIIGVDILRIPGFL